jgi:hypothetical protein
MMGVLLRATGGAAPAAEVVTELTAERFETEVLKQKGPALVLFWVGGGWNSYERVFNELYEAMGREFGAGVRFYRFHLGPVFQTIREPNPMAVVNERYGVPILPTTIMYRDGRAVDRLRGGFNDRSLWGRWEQGMREWIESNLTKPNGQWVLRIEGYPEPTRVPVDQARKAEPAPGQAPRFGGPEPIFKIVPAPAK